jgi:hypothetical protein
MPSNACQQAVRLAIPLAGAEYVPFHNAVLGATGGGKLRDDFFFPPNLKRAEVSSAMAYAGRATRVPRAESYLPMPRRLRPRRRRKGGQCAVRCSGLPRTCRRLAHAHATRQRRLLRDDTPQRRGFDCGVLFVSHDLEPSVADSSINYSVRNNSRVQSEGETVKLGSVPTQPDGSSHL